MGKAFLVGVPLGVVALTIGGPLAAVVCSICVAVYFGFSEVADERVAEAKRNQDAYRMLAERGHNDFNQALHKRRR